MADPTAEVEEGDDGGESHGRAPSPGMPAWARMFLIVGIALVLLFVVLKVTGVGGDHGPGRHSGGDGPPSTVVGDGVHRSPVDHRP